MRCLLLVGFHLELYKQLNFHLNAFIMRFYGEAFLNLFKSIRAYKTIFCKFFFKFILSVRRDNRSRVYPQHSHRPVRISLACFLHVL